MKVEKKLEHETVESARSAAREMQKQAARSAEKAGKNKGVCFILVGRST